MKYDKKDVKRVVKKPYEKPETIVEDLEIYSTSAH